VVRTRPGGRRGATRRRPNPPRVTPGVRYRGPDRRDGRRRPGWPRLAGRRGE
jgi:hypothetical protein